MRANLGIFPSGGEDIIASNLHNDISAVLEWLKKCLDTSGMDGTGRCVCVCVGMNSTLGSVKRGQLEKQTGRGLILDADDLKEGRWHTQETESALELESYIQRTLTREYSHASRQMDPDETAVACEAIVAFANRRGTYICSTVRVNKSYLRAFSTCFVIPRLAASFCAGLSLPPPAYLPLK